MTRLAFKQLTCQHLHTFSMLENCVKEISDGIQWHRI
jgi:hypothetical protein